MFNLQKETSTTTEWYKNAPLIVHLKKRRKVKKKNLKIKNESTRR